jgi:hypothetical protein
MKSAFAPAWLLLAFVISGCGGNKSSPTSPGTPVGKAPAPKVIVVPDKALTARVTFVNTGARFVVLTFPLGRMPADGQRFNLYRRGSKVGEVKVNGPQQDDGIAADLVEGNAELGDEAR